MPLFVAVAAMLALAAQSDNDRPIVVKAFPWAPFISPMGEPFRARSAGDDPFARWFQQADANSDGRLTVEEMRTDGVRFFKTIDRNHDGEIDPVELAAYESEVAPEVQVNTKWKPSRQVLAEAKAAKQGDGRQKSRMDYYIDGYQPHGLQGAARYGLLNLPEPVAGADADFNRGTSLDEFQRAAIQRFQLLDAKKAAYLTLADLEPLLPTRPQGKKVVQFPNEEPRDTRIGQPFPEGN